LIAVSYLKPDFLCERALLYYTHELVKNASTSMRYRSLNKFWTSCNTSRKLVYFTKFSTYDSHLLCSFHKMLWALVN